MFKKTLLFLPLFIRSYKAFKYAINHNLPGCNFGRFGRRLGIKLALKRSPSGLNYILNPVSIVRYFEFSFILSFISEHCQQCLDISSPRLFSFYVASKYPTKSIQISNPDKVDFLETQGIIQKLGMKNIRLNNFAIDNFANKKEKYDCIWSISVIEHINGTYDDSYAVKVMYDSLNIGGKLLLTFPVDRKAWDEYRSSNIYGTQTKNKDNNQFFFQRFYDKEAIKQRIIRPLKKEPTTIRWFGEKTAGWFHAYEKRWIQGGLKCTVEDPKELVENFSEFNSWEEMPGVGVCGIAFEK